jgi:hypothetical protein
MNEERKREFHEEWAELIGGSPNSKQEGKQRRVRREDLRYLTDEALISESEYISDSDDE